MQNRITANIPVDETAIRNLVRRKLLDDRSDGEPRSPRSAEDGDHGGRAPDKRARLSALRGQSLDRNTHPI